MFSHKGIQIKVNNYGKFDASVNDAPVSCDTLADAKTRIEELLKAGKRSVALPVVGILRSDGYCREANETQSTIGEATFSGFNRTDGSLVLRDVAKGFQLNDVMADTPKNRALLGEMIANRIETKRLETLRTAREIKKTYGRIDIGKYDEMLAKAEAIHAASVADESAEV